MSQINKRHFNCKVKLTPDKHLTHVCPGFYFNIMKELQISQQGKNKGKYVAFVDDEDFERVNVFKWHVQIAHNNIIYACRRKKTGNKKINISIHEFIMGINWIDHIDHNGLNCQKSNMRKCTNQENIFNSRPYKNRASKYKGVNFKKDHNKYGSHIFHNGKQIHLGYFENEINAAKAYDKAAKAYFKEFAYLNFP